MKHTDKAPGTPARLPDWASIDTVLLDMDGTLLDLQYDNFFWLRHVPRRYAEKHRLDEDEARQRLLAKYGEVRGTLDWYCVDFWTRTLDLDIAGMKRDVADRIAIRPQADDFLLWLNRHRKRVVLVTNAHPASLNLKMEVTGLHGHFDNIIHSHALGLAKEHPGFWRKLQRLEPYEAGRTLLIDDNFEVLDSARKYGIACCLGIHLPDSQAGPLRHDHYHTLRSFSEIMV